MSWFSITFGLAVTAISLLRLLPWFTKEAQAVVGLFECLFHLSKEICYEVKQRRVLYRDVNIAKYMR